MTIMNQLPTPEVCDIVRRLRPRLYINFFQTLPPEVCLKILGYLDPASLISTARASREWRLLATDRKLWEHLYYLEGFRVIPSEVQRFEDWLKVQAQLGSKAPLHERTAQRSAQPLLTDGDSEMMDADASPVIRQPPSIFGQSSLFGSAGDRNKENTGTTSRASGKSRILENKDDEIMTGTPERRSRPGKSALPFESAALAALDTIKSPLVVLDRSNKQPKLNWQYLYSVRRRLEANWEAEKYINFQLPHQDHPEERHKECIYTIQHSGKYLVSGSRDRTVRIWNLDTQRLIHPPLAGHTGSVLCLQFDADPDEDLIVSGSSDATICLWRFSTGQLIQRMKKAHYESVLNVRFDKRVLVTCSKDKTIKIFNRHPLRPGDHGYPDMAEVVNPVPMFLNNYGFNPAPTAGLPVKPPYSIIASLEGHGAAVNAVQIHGDQVVSASGDRTIKVWNWPEQTCVRTLIGHTKGIACVQYDGRRIVSGSSDNEVKVFDKDSGLEVASLRAHSDLVRTVQAGFGDLPYSAEEDKEDAKMIDNEYFRAIDEGKVSRTMSLQRGRSRNAGSRRPEDITAYGAKLPPGGGGGRFGRIVSGSYDGTIIIWRRDKEGVWKAQHTLRQEEGAIAARTLQRRTNPTTTTPNPPTNIIAANNTSAVSQSNIVVGPNGELNVLSQALSQQAVNPAPTTPTIPDGNAPTTPFAPGSQAFYRHLIDVSVLQGAASLRLALQNHPELIQSPYLQTAIAALPPTAQRAQLNYAVTEAINSQLHSNVQPAGHVGTQATNITTQASTQATTQATPAVQQIAAQTPQNPPPAAPPAVHHHHHHAHRAQVENYRVFKLQFDARRIISCSQTPIIVGWDFANGDEQIIEASRFFAPIE